MAMSLDERDSFSNEKVDDVDNEPIRGDNPLPRSIKGDSQEKDLSCDWKEQRRLRSLQPM